eukprot:m.282783 g.282783  ORF g.282783 m.282783 type:complete len:1739 (+) comp22900_c8_seq6:352-5568(+)
MAPPVIGVRRFSRFFDFPAVVWCPFFHILLRVAVASLCPVRQGVKQQSAAMASERVTPKLFRALYDFNSTDEEDLTFTAGQMIAVTDQGDGPDSWWYGEIDGREGNFPGHFVCPIGQVRKSFTAPEDFEDTEESGVAAAAAGSSAAPNLQATPVRSALKSPRPGARARQLHISFNLQNTLHEVESKEEGDRKGEFFPQQSQAQWEKEEAEEKARQLEDRWSYLERFLPPGQKCEERLAAEKVKADEEQAKQEAEERRQQRRLELKRKMAEARELKRAMEQGDAPSDPSTAPAASPAVVVAPPVPTTPTPPVPGGLDFSKDGRSERLRLLQEARQRSAAPAAPPPKGAAAAAAPATTAPPRPGRPAPAVAEAVAEAVANPSPPGSPRSRKLAQSRRKGEGSNTGSTDSLPPVPDRPSMEKKENGTNGPTSHLQQSSGPPDTSTTASNQPIDELDVAIQKLEAKIQDLSNKTASGKDGFAVEFSQLDAEDRRNFKLDLCAAGRAHPALNRYNDILPYDKYRVTLGKPASQTEGYINASYIKGLLPGSPDYIAAQGPLEETSEDFWKMLLQERSRLIIMVTRLQEGRRVKCHKYWPDVGQTTTYTANAKGPAVSVQTVAEKVHPAWQRREFVVKSGDLADMHVTQLHFTDWPDHGVPESAVCFLNFLHTAMAAQRAASDEAKQQAERRAPAVLVHCSAGVGRSGVFCLIYSTLTYLPFLGRSGCSEISVMESVRKMRTSRRYMVQTVDQYKFCYTAILHAAKLYQDGSRQLRKKMSEKKGSKTDVGGSPKKDAGAVPVRAAPAVPAAATAVTAPAPESPRSSLGDPSPLPSDEPVWLHTGLDRHEVEGLLKEGRPANGRFLVLKAPGSSDRYHISVYVDREIHHFYVQRDSDSDILLVDRRRCGSFNNIAGLIDYMRHVDPMSNWALVLTEFVPRADASDEAIAHEIKKTPRPFAPNRPSTDTTPPQPPHQPPQRQGSTSSVGSTSSAADRDAKTKTSPPSGADKAGAAGFPPTVRTPSNVSLASSRSDASDDTPKRRSLRQRSMENFDKLKKKFSSPTKDKRAEPPARAMYSVPPEEVTQDALKVNGRLVTISGRAEALTFLNGVYCEQNTVIHGKPTFRLRNPIPRDYGHLSGQYVYLFHDSQIKAWVLYMNGFGVLASVASDAASPDLVKKGWFVLDQKANELVEDPLLQCSLLPVGPVEEDGETAATVAVLKQKLDALQERERVALQLVKSQREVGQQLAESQAREGRLATQLANLQSLLTSKLMAGEGDDLPQRRAILEGTQTQLNEQMQRADEHIQYLQAQLNESEAVREDMSGRISKLELSEEGLTRLLSRAQANEDEARRELQVVRAQFDELARDTAVCKVRLAEEEERNQDLRAKVAELENALVRMSCAEEENAELRAKIEALERAVSSTNGSSNHSSPTKAVRGLPSGVLWNELDEGDDDDDQETSIDDFPPGGLNLGRGMAGLQLSGLDSETRDSADEDEQHDGEGAEEEEEEEENADDMEEDDEVVVVGEKSGYDSRPGSPVRRRRPKPQPVTTQRTKTNKPATEHDDHFHVGRFVCYVLLLLLLAGVFLDLLHRCGRRQQVQLVAHRIPPHHHIGQSRAKHHAKRHQPVRRAARPTRHANRVRQLQLRCRRALEGDGLRVGRAPAVRRWGRRGGRGGRGGRSGGSRKVGPQPVLGKPKRHGETNACRPRKKKREKNDRFFVPLAFSLREERRRCRCPWRAPSLCGSRG